MYEISVETQISAAHRLENYHGKCENLHGHNWRIEIFLAGTELDSAGMLYDFTILKQRIKEVDNLIDHSFLNDNKAFGKNPSAENIARWYYEKLSSKINSNYVRVKKVKVWESEKQGATYFE